MPLVTAHWQWAGQCHWSLPIATDASGNHRFRVSDADLLVTQHQEQPDARGSLGKAETFFGEPGLQDTVIQKLLM